MFRSFKIIIREFRCSLLKLLHIHDLVRFCKQGVVAAYDVVWECVVGQWLGVRRRLRSCHNTDYVHINGRDRTIIVILAKYCIELPDDGPLVIRNMLEQF